MIDESIDHAIRRQAADIARLATTPEFLAMVEHFVQVEPADRLGAVEEMATVERLAFQAVSMPPGLRVSPRTFEDPDDSLSVGEPLVSFKDGRGCVVCNGTIVIVEEVTE